MYKIQILTSSIVIHDYKKGNYVDFKKKLSVWQKTKNGGNYISWFAYKEDEENEIMYIHKGIKLTQLMYYFPNHELEYDLSGKPCKYMKLKLTVQPRSDIQKESIEYLLGKGKFSEFKNETQKFLCLKPGDGKAQPINTIIPTPNGFKKLGDLNVGDYVFDRNGKPTEVTGIFRRGKLNNYKVELSDGRVTYCNDDHLWTVKYASIDNDTKKRVIKEKTIPLSEIMSKGILNKQGRYNHWIPMNGEVEYPEITLPVDPYILGCFIGDGCLTEKALTLSAKDEFIVEKVANILDCKPFKYHDSNYSYKFEMKEKLFSEDSHTYYKYIRTKDVFENDNFSLIGYKSDNKYIPDIYKTASIEQRYQLIQGLFDTDGYIGDNERCHVKYYTISKKLAEDVKEILISLGLSATISEDTRKNRKDYKCYVIHVNIPNYKKTRLFSIPRKVAIAEKHKNEIKRRDYDYIAITSVEKMDNQEEMLCIKVDNPDHLYLTSNYIVTHNTYTAINYVTKSGRIPIIIVDNDKILNQWKESFKKFTNIEDDEMFTISGSATIKKLMRQTNNPYKVYLASHRTLDSYCDGNWELLNDLFQKIGIGDKIFDEAHVEWRNIFYIDINTDVKNTIYLTATPARSNYNEQEVYSRLFDGVVTFGLTESRNEKYIRYIEYLWNTHPTDYEELNMSNAHGFDSNRYNDYLLNKKYDKYFKMLKQLLNDLWNKDPEQKIAIVVNCNNMIEKLYDDFSKSIFINNETKKARKIKVGRFCGLVAKSERDKELDNQLILTTLKGFGKGVDVDDLCIVINTVSVSSAVLMEQLSGRLRYKEGVKKYFIQLTDNGFKQCRNHSKIRNRFMQKVAKKSYVLSDKT